MNAAPATGSFGLEAQVIQKIQSVLRRHPSVEQATLYGSRAKGNFKPASDIDLTLTGTALDTTELLQIEVELDDLMLPYKIDLSLIHQIEDAELLGHIERIGKLFYKRP